MTTKDIAPMEALLVPELPKGKNWRYEPKFDGFRCLAYKRGKKISLQSKSGKPLDRYFPDVVSMLAALPVKNAVLDGELLIEGAEGFSFSDLQMRLHPAASRVKKLAAEQPASFILFDLLETEDGSMMDATFAERRAALETFHARYCKKQPRLMLSPQVSTIAKAQRWLNSKELNVDGIVAKDMTANYTPGERVMQKFKVIRTADCVVGGFRYGTNSKDVASLLLGLYNDEGLLDHVGFTSSIAAADKKALTAKLKKLVQAPGFTGKAPGGPSRWSTDRSADWQPLKPEMVVEVSFDHVSDGRFRHGTKLLRFRPDKKPSQCRMEQIQK